MGADKDKQISRRNILATIGFAGASTLTDLPDASASNEHQEKFMSSKADLPDVSLTGAASRVADGYQILGALEASVLEALVNHLWPADHLSPSGTEIGVVVFIDRQLAGAFGQGDRLYLNAPFREGTPEHGYQVAMTPADYFCHGLKNLNDFCSTKFGKPLDKSSNNQVENVLSDLLLQQKSTQEFSLATWFNDLFYPMFVRGAFSDPIYGGNRNKLAWLMIGYPGLPATYSEDIIVYSGKRHPNYDAPMSIQDFY